MSFTNVWDASQPTENQVASLYAQDLRNIKIDVMQRMAAFGAGISTAIQTPDASANAVFGNPNNGVLYYAYDTGQVFQWNGSAWIVVSVHKNFVDTTSPIGSAPGTVLNSITIPANLLAAGCRLRLLWNLFITGNSGQYAINLKFDNTGFLSSSGSAPVNGTSYSVIVDALLGSSNYLQITTLSNILSTTAVMFTNAPMTIVPGASHTVSAALYTGNTATVQGQGMSLLVDL